MRVNVQASVSWMTGHAMMLVVAISHIGNSTSIELASFPVYVFSTFDGGPSEESEEKDERDGEEDEGEWIESTDVA